MFDVMKMMYFLLLFVLIGYGPKYETKYYQAISLDKPGLVQLEPTWASMFI